MATVDERIAFAEQNIKDKSGKRFSVKGRDWIRDEFYTPVDGWKTWPASEDNPLCDACATLANQIHETRQGAREAVADKCTGGSCKGLTVQPVLITVLCLPRRSGKTFNTAAFALSLLLQERHKRIAFICSSEDQMRALVRENHSTIIEQNKKMKAALQVFEHRGEIRCAKTKSMFEGMSTSHGSITGRGRTHVIVDEARDVPARSMMSLLPSVYESNGVQCPRGHIQTANTLEAPTHCPVCRSELEPWYGRILLMSSAGIIEGTGGEKDWFPELVEHLRANPQPNVHLYESQQIINPDVSEVITNTVETVFGSLESTRSYVAVEVGNQFTRKGETLLVKPQIDAVVDGKLRNRLECDAPSVAFLDTSKSNDLTSLVIVSEVAQKSVDPWGFIQVERIDIWDPKKLPGGVINPAEVLAHLDMVIPLYPNMKALRVDSRVMPWAIALVKKAKRERTYGRIIDGWNKGKAERKSSWALLHQRILSKTIAIPNNPTLRKELLNVRRITDLDGQMDIRDGTNRKVRHVDVAEALSVCCYLAHLESLQSRTNLAATIKDTRARDILKSLYRPVRDSIDLDKF